MKIPFQARVSSVLFLQVLSFSYCYRCQIGVNITTVKPIFQPLGVVIFGNHCMKTEFTIAFLTEPIVFFFFLRKQISAHARHQPKLVKGVQQRAQREELFGEKCEVTTFVRLSSSWRTEQFYLHFSIFC
jgi:hypothetical protein